MQSQLTISAASIAADLQTIRSKNPLVHNITNFVVMQQTANALLALGASPIMAHAEEELSELINIGNALVINIGTLDKHWINSMKTALPLANLRKIPVVLDPVGAGASKLRTKTALDLLEIGNIQVVRGNAGEIMALAGDAIQSKGVDSQYATDKATDAAARLSQHYHCTVVVSGARDLVMQQQSYIGIDNGVALMTKITGMGCTATALIGAFCAVNNNYALASAHAMAVMGISGEIAAEHSKGPGTMQIQFLDALYHLDETAIAAHLRINHEVAS